MERYKDAHGTYAWRDSKPKKEEPKKIEATKIEEITEIIDEKKTFEDLKEKRG